MNTRTLPRSHAARRAQREQRREHWQRWWPWIKRAVVVGFLALVAVLIFRYARGIDWGEVWASVKALPMRVVLLAIGLAAVSHALYSCFDLIGRRYTGHTLPARVVMAIAFTSYAFNLNLGSTVGGIGFRLRLYSQYGLPYAPILKIVTLSMVSNWLGYLLLAGGLFTFAPLELPPHWKMSSDGLSLLGLVLLAMVLGYLVLCRWSRTRNWTVRGHDLFLPQWRMSLVQVGISAVNWAVIAGVIHTLLQGRIEYTTVLSVLLIAAISGLVVRVPGGLGVLEAVFLALLSHRVPEGQLLGALLAYRAIYYFGALAAATLLYLGMEVRVRRTEDTK